MAGTGSYSGGSASADYRFSAPELLSELPDNNAQLIQAKNVRDSVWTLWNRIDDVQITASQAFSQSSMYSNSTPMPQTLGGLTSGTTFSNNTLSEVFDSLFYPYIDPTIQFSLNPITKEYGAPTTVSFTFSLSPGTTDPVSSIDVDGEGVVPTGGYQTGTINHTTGTHSTSPGLSVSNIFTMSVVYNAVTEYYYTELIWSNRTYVGTIDLSGAPTYNPNLTLDQSGPTLASVASKCTDVVIRTMGSFLSDGFDDLNEGGDFTCNGEYVVIAFPSTFGTPDFFVNNLKDTSFTKIRDNSTFANSYGFTYSYDVWVSNTQRYETSNVKVFATVGTTSQIGTMVNSAIRPISDLDPIATAYSSEIMGGHHSYDTILNRDLTIEPRREWGMMSTVYNDGTASNNGTYILEYNHVDSDIMNNANWVLFDRGGTDIKYYISPSESITVPYNTEYFVYGDLTLAGELINYGKVVVANGAFSITGSGTFSNFGELDVITIGGGGTTGSTTVKYLIESSENIDVPLYEEYLVYGDLEIQGILTNNGKVVIIDGNMVLSGGTFSNISGNLELVSTNTMVIGRPVVSSPVDVMLKTDSSGNLGYATSSMFIYSPNGTKWKLEIDDLGGLTASLA